MLEDLRENVLTLLGISDLDSQWNANCIGERPLTRQTLYYLPVRSS